jgi:hypothetical protein
VTEDDLTPRQKGYIEGYAAALQKILYAVTGDCGCSKSYDPMTIEGGTMHSYAFNMKDGGRHHPLSDYKSPDEICDLLLEETLEEFREFR